MSERKTRITVTIDPRVAEYAEHLVETGKAESVSAVVNSALWESRRRDARARRLWKELTGRAGPEVHAKVERMLAHIEAQRVQLPPSHR